MEYPGGVALLLPKTYCSDIGVGVGGVGGVGVGGVGVGGVGVGGVGPGGVGPPHVQPLWGSADLEKHRAWAPSALVHHAHAGDAVHAVASKISSQAPLEGTPTFVFRSQELCDVLAPNDRTIAEESISGRQTAVVAPQSSRNFQKAAARERQLA